MLSNAEVAEIAKSLGHTQVSLIQVGSRWGWTCDCGAAAREAYWLVAPAVSEAQYHLRRAAQQHVDKLRRDGRVVPGLGSARL